MDKLEFEYLGPYKIEGQLGRGGMGTVYKGRHSKSGEAVAVKVIAPSVANEMRFRRRFAAEIEMLTRLRHPNIVQMIGFGEEDGLLFYAMEYVDGHSLQDHLRQYKRIDWSEVIQVGIDVTAALKHAHDMGVIHRDLKPANLMLCRDTRIKLTDFGIAKPFGSMEMTAVGSVIGTADFMPPEQAEGKTVTVRSDLYSLGSVLYALMVGHAPFAGKTLPEVLYAVRYSPAPDTTPYAQDAPPELHALIAELLEKDPLKRPPTALVVGNRLKAMQQGIAKLEVDRQRTQNTVAKSQAATTMAKELTSIDLNDDHDEELKVTGHHPTQDQPTAIASESVLRQLGEPNSQRPAESRLSLEGEVTSLSPARSQADLPSIDEPLPAKTTHFTTVTDADAKKFTLGSAPVEHSPGFDWIKYGSMAGLVLVLLISIGLAVQFFQPRTADQLHEEIMQVVESGDAGQLTSSADLLRDFVERFPKDTRVADVKQLLNEVEFLQASRRVKLRGRLNPEKLSVVEQGFLQCVESMEGSSEEARKKFTAFLAVYSVAKNLDEKDARYVELAEVALHTFVDRRIPSVNESAADLEALIRHGESNKSKAELPAFYRSLIELYGDKPWAKESLSRIRGLAQ